MALTLEANYSKKLGLPGYSSHQFSVTIRSELSDLSKVEQETQRLYSLLQTCVDREIQQTGYLPGHEQNHRNGNGRNGHAEEWNCSVKQKDLILKIVEENNLDKSEVEQLAMQRFNIGVRKLNKLQASGLIEELVERYPSRNGGHRSVKTHAGGRR